MRQEKNGKKAVFQRYLLQILGHASLQDFVGWSVCAHALFFPVSSNSCITFNVFFFLSLPLSLSFSLFLSFSLSSPLSPSSLSLSHLSLSVSLYLPPSVFVSICQSLCHFPSMLILSLFSAAQASSHSNRNSGKPVFHTFTCQVQVQTHSNPPPTTLWKRQTEREI